jgi:hypothetical protein
MYYMGTGLFAGVLMDEGWNNVGTMLITNLSALCEDAWEPHPIFKNI